MVTADSRFTRADRIRLEHPATAAGVPTARLLSRQGGGLAVPVTTSARKDDTAAFQWIVAEVALAPLAPGDYAIEVVSGDAKKVTAFSVVP